MKIYFAGAIRGGRDYADMYAHVIAGLQKSGYTVLSEHVGAKDLKETLNDRQIFQRDITWIDESDVVIADVSQASTGVGFEVSYAFYNGQAIHCFAIEQANVSAMITGCFVMNFQRYNTKEDYLEKVLTLLDEFNQPDID